MMNYVTHDYAKQRGLSLIELMVAMTLGLILLAGIVQVFIGNKKSFDITRDLVDMQENGRMSMTFLGESVRLADHWAGVVGSDITGTASVTGNDSCDQDWLLETGVAIQGFEGAGSSPIDCIKNYVPNSDVIVVRYADGREMLSDTAIATTANEDNIFVRIATAQEGLIFKGDSSSTAISSIPIDAGVVTFPYVVELYYLRQCSITNGDDCADSIPTLVRKTLQADEFTDQPLVEGIEQLQFDYGVDTDEDLISDTYQTASAVTDWDDVVTVRMSVVARSGYEDQAYQESRTFNLQGGYAYTPATADQKYRRKQYDREINIRNRSRL